MAKKYTVNAVIEIKGVKHYPGETLSLDGKFEDEIKANQLIPLTTENPQEKGGKGAGTPKPENPPTPPKEGENTQNNGGNEGQGKEPDKTGFTAEQIAEAAKSIT